MQHQPSPSPPVTLSELPERARVDTKPDLSGSTDEETVPEYAFEGAPPFPRKWTYVTARDVSCTVSQLGFAEQTRTPSPRPSHFHKLLLPLSTLSRLSRLNGATFPPSWGS